MLLVTHRNTLMNIRLTSIVLCSLTAQLFAQAPNQATSQLTALLFTDNSSTPAWIVEASKTAIRYRESEGDTESVVANRSDFKHIYIYEPRDFAAAMDLYQARKYEEAKAAFIAVKKLYLPMAALDNSPSVLAEFYEMECLRKLGDLDGLASALQKFDKSRITNENHQRQIDLYVLWQLVQTKNWANVEKLVKERAKSRLPGDQRAQISYCHGLALEGLERPDEAISAYQHALISDAGASEDITRKAALRILTILTKDQDVQRAIRDWKPENNKNTPGYNKLLEAASVAVLYEMSLGGGSPLPNEFKDLTKYRPAPVATAASENTEAAESEKPAATEPAKPAKADDKKPAAAEAKKSEAP